MSFIQLVQKIRPAPLQVLIVNALGLNKRREAGFGRYKFFVDPSSDFGSSIESHAYEATMIATLQQYLKPGGVFLDIGANEGFFSVLAGDLVGPKGRVVAVEPQDRLIPIIEKNLELNGVSNCVIEHCVISDKSGDVTIHLAPSTNTGSTSMFPITRYKLQTQTIPGRTLAELLDRNGIDTVDLVKIDVEGAEYEIIMPSGDILKTGRLRNIALEYHPVILARRGLDMDAMHNLMTSSGYRLREDHIENSIYEFVGQA